MVTIYYHTAGFVREVIVFAKFARRDNIAKFNSKELFSFVCLCLCIDSSK